MSRSSFCKIKYMNGLFSFKGQEYDWDWFQNTGSHTRTKITTKSPLPARYGVSSSIALPLNFTFQIQRMYIHFKILYLVAKTCMKMKVEKCHS